MGREGDERDGEKEIWNRTEDRQDRKSLDRVSIDRDSVYLFLIFATFCSFFLTGNRKLKNRKR